MFSDSPAYAELKNSDIFILKTDAWYHFVVDMKYNQVNKWYQVGILSMNVPILILEQKYYYFWILHK